MYTIYIGEDPERPQGTIYISNFICLEVQPLMGWNATTIQDENTTQFFVSFHFLVKRNSKVGWTHFPRWESSWDIHTNYFLTNGSFNQNEGTPFKWVKQSAVAQQCSETTECQIKRSPVYQPTQRHQFLWNNSFPSASQTNKVWEELLLSLLTWHNQISRCHGCKTSRVRNLKQENAFFSTETGICAVVE